MDTALKSLLEEGDSPEEAQDFAARYTTGDPREGYSSAEAQKYFQKVASKASPQQLEMAARKTTSNMSEADRSELATMLEDRQQGQNMVKIDPKKGATSQPGVVSLDDVIGGLFGGAAAGKTGGSAGSVPGLETILGNLMGGGAAGGGAGRKSGGGGLDDLMGGLLGGLLGAGMAKGAAGKAKASSDLPGAFPTQAETGSTGSATASAPAPEAGKKDDDGGLGTIGKMIMGGIAAFGLSELIDRDKKR